jgi:hypothetical protein
MKTKQSRLQCMPCERFLYDLPTVAVALRLSEAEVWLLVVSVRMTSSVVTAEGRPLFDITTFYRATAQAVRSPG